MSNGHESTFTAEVKGLQKDLEYLGKTVEKSTEILQNQMEKNALLHNKMSNLEDYQKKQDKAIEDIKNILFDSNKQTGLITDFRNLNQNFANYMDLMKQEKAESKARAIEREFERKEDELKKERERRQLEEKKEKEKEKQLEDREKKKAELDAKKEKDFNRKIAVIMALITLLGIFMPILLDWLKGK